MELPDYKDIAVGVAGERGTLSLERPEKLNALSPRTLRELARAAVSLNEQPGLKVVVVGGKGRAFSAGADASAFAGSGASDANGPARDDADAGRLMADAMERIDAVTIAAIQGHCVGGGLVLAGTCDLRIAARGTTFSIPEIDLGIPLAWGGIPRLVRDIGPALTKELVMTCRPFGAEEALAAGFLNRVVPADELDVVVEELAATLASKPRLALLSTKRHVDAVTQEMVGTARSWSDADGLMAGLADPEGNESALRYLGRLSGERDSRGGARRWRLNAVVALHLGCRTVSTSTEPHRRGPRVLHTTGSVTEGIYGLILATSVIAVSREYESSNAGLIGVTVLVTGIVFWLAHVYARVLARSMEHRRMLKRPEIREVLRHDWPLVEVTMPLVLVLALGADRDHPGQRSDPRGDDPRARRARCRRRLRSADGRCTGARGDPLRRDRGRPRRRHRPAQGPRPLAAKAQPGPPARRRPLRGRSTPPRSRA